MGQPELGLACTVTQAGEHGNAPKPQASKHGEFFFWGGCNIKGSNLVGGHDYNKPTTELLLSLEVQCKHQ